MDKAADALAPGPTGDVELDGNIDRSLRVLEDIRTRGFDSWYVMFSGGKDSTLLAILVFEFLRRVRDPPPHTRFVYTDSQLEFPQAKTVAIDLLGHIRALAQEEELPAQTHVVRPRVQDSYWVNLIGRGYTPPRAHFRWCTPRLKVNPSWGIIANDGGKPRAVLTGVRFDESSARSRNLRISCAKGGECGQDFWMRYGPQGTQVAYFAPVIFWRTCKVWDFLTLIAPSWGWPTQELVSLYGGERLRFGCWTCTLVSRDKAAESLIKRGNAGQLKKLNEFRSFLDISSREPSTRRRNSEGELRGFRLGFCGELLNRLLNLQEETGLMLITQNEVREIESIWKRREQTESENLGSLA